MKNFNNFQLPKLLIICLYLFSPKGLTAAPHKSPFYSLSTTTMLERIEKNESSWFPLERLSMILHKAIENSFRNVIVVELLPFNEWGWRQCSLVYRNTLETRKYVLIDLCNEVFLIDMTFEVLSLPDLDPGRERVLRQNGKSMTLVTASRKPWLLIKALNQFPFWNENIYLLHLVKLQKALLPSQAILKRYQRQNFKRGNFIRTVPAKSQYFDIKRSIFQSFNEAWMF